MVCERDLRRGARPVFDKALSGRSKVPVVEGELSGKLSDKDAELYDKGELEAIAESVSSTQRSSREHVKAAIIELCSVAELSGSRKEVQLPKDADPLRQ